MLCVSFHIDRLKAALTKMPEGGTGFILPDHNALAASLYKGNPAALPLEERMIVFAYLNEAVYARARENGHFVDQLYIHPIAGNISFEAVCEPLYRQEIDLLLSISHSVDYSDTLKNNIALLTETLFDELIAIDGFRNDFLLWDGLPIDQKRLSALSFLYVFAQAADKLFPWKTRPTDFYYVEEGLTHTDMAAFCPDFMTSEKPPEHYIAGNEKNLNEMTNNQFFYMLHHEAIHNLIYQMTLSYYTGDCDDDSYRADAQLKQCLMRNRYSATGDIQSLYFANCEEQICYANQDRAWEKMRQLSPSRQLPYFPAPLTGPL